MRLSGPRELPETRYKIQEAWEYQIPWQELHRKEPDFEIFCRQNVHWLNDYALFSSLTTHDKDVYWQQWPEGLARRGPRAIASASRQLSESVARACFLQYLFYRKRTDLKPFCEKHHIRIIGGLLHLCFWKVLCPRSVPHRHDAPGQLTPDTATRLKWLTGICASGCGQSESIRRLSRLWRLLWESTTWMF